MIFYSPAKINLGLQVLDKRSDGYHNLKSLFLTVDWQDTIEINPAKSFNFVQTGLKIPLEKETDNLVLRAFKLLQADYKISDCYIHLHKIIPLGSGLGGGSSNGTTTLLALNNIFQLNLGREKLCYYAAQLGSDCPFFVEKVPQIVTGRGDILKPHLFEEAQISQLKKIIILIIIPSVAINTAWAFKNMLPSASVGLLDQDYRRPIQLWKGNISNDFESIIFKHHPELKEIKIDLYEAGASYASLTGTGSAVYGFFEKAINLDKFQNYKFWQGRFLNLESDFN